MKAFAEFNLRAMTNLANFIQEMIDLMMNTKYDDHRKIAAYEIKRLAISSSKFITEMQRRKFDQITPNEQQEVINKVNLTS